MKPRVQPYGTKNISGANIEKLRKSRGMRQFELVLQMQLRGVDINPSSLAKLEGQVRLASDRDGGAHPPQGRERRIIPPPGGKRKPHRR